MDIFDLLDSVSVMPPGMWENEYGPLDWYAVYDDNGIIAYFSEESNACAFRLDHINRILNT